MPDEPSFALNEIANVTTLKVNFTLIDRKHQRNYIFGFRIRNCSV